MSDAPPPPAGWFTDPEDPTLLRYWDGSAWTDQRVASQTATPAVAGGPELPHRPISVPPLLGAGALLVVAGLGRAVSYLAPYDAFGVSLAFSVLEILGWVGAFLCFLAAGYPSRGTGARVLTLVLVGIYILSGIISIGIALNPSAPAGLFTLLGLFGLAATGVGIAFAISAIRTRGLARRIRLLPLALYLGLIAFGVLTSVANSASASIGGLATTTAIVIAAISGLVPATVGTLFLAFGRQPHSPAD
jgi:hypothetical protein